MQEAYQSFRQDSLQISINDAFKKHIWPNGNADSKNDEVESRGYFTPDTALIHYLQLQEAKEVELRAIGQPYERHTEIASISSKDMNCFCIWARPPQGTLKLLRSIQSELHGLVGDDLYLIPAEDLHLSVVELSHRHTVDYLYSVKDFLGEERLKRLLNLPARAGHHPNLGKPMLLFDHVGIAVNFLPLVEEAADYTYHHLRTDLHSALLETGLSVDTCYTAPNAHITVGRFKSNSLLEPIVSGLDGSESVKEFRSRNLETLVRGIEQINKRLEESWMEDPEKEPGHKWTVTAQGLEAQLGYIKFGRQRERSELVGQALWGVCTLIAVSIKTASLKDRKNAFLGYIIY